MADSNNNRPNDKENIPKINPPPKRKKRVHFSKEDDVDILGLVIQEDPFLNRAKWETIADTIKARRKIDVTGRNVRERVFYIVDEFDKKEPQLIYRSGQEECVDEWTQRLTTVSQMKKYAEENPHLVKKKKRPEKNEGKCMRDAAAQRLVDITNCVVEIAEDSNDHPVNIGQIRSLYHPPSIEASDMEIPHDFNFFSLDELAGEDQSQHTSHVSV